ncbi:special sigma factor [Weeksellaceae bacterium A-14]
MENDFLKDFILQISKQQEQKNADERRKKHFQTIGRKGGLKKKTSQQFSKVVSVRFTEKEFEEIEKQASKYNLKISKYLRLLLTEKELRINEFKTDQVLLQYGNHFVRIRNLLRHREFSEFENKKEILREIENVTQLIYQYLYEKQNTQQTE